MPRRFNTTRTFWRSRRETLWLEVPLVNTTLAAGGSAILSHVLTTAEKALRPFTVIRTRLIFHVASDQVSADETQACALGVAVVSDQAVAIGITAVPTPSTDRASDLWLVFDEMYSRVTVGGTADSVGVYGVLRDVDSKAMRKVEEGSDIVIVQESDAGQSAGLNVAVAGRILIKLH